MINYENAFKKPFLDIKKLVIGLAIAIISSILLTFPIKDPTQASIFTLTSLLIGFLLTGYYLRVALFTFKKKKELPSWENWSNLFLKGLFVTILGILYVLPVVLLSLVIGGAVFFSDLPSQLVSLGISVLITLLFLLFIAYILPSVILTYLKKGRFTAAFNFKIIFSKAFQKSYFLAWLVSAIYVLVLGLIFGLIPYVGNGIASFITAVTSMTLLAEAY